MITDKHKLWIFGGKRPFFKGLRITSMVIFGIIAAAVFGLVFGYFVMILWNWLMPRIFDLPAITYWQAFGIVILVKLIFGAIGRGRDHWRKNDYYDEHFHEHGKEWGPWDEKWSMKDGWRKYRYYHDFWREEGKGAFENYIKKRESEKKEEG